MKFNGKFVLMTDDQQFVMDVSKGLLITTSKQIEKNYKGNKYQAAKGFATELEAQQFLDQYKATKLPKGKRHTELTVVCSICHLLPSCCDC